jgi:glycine oxidase
VAADTPRTPYLTPHTPDVVVIGGGVIGCSIAYHLSLGGVRVVVLERQALAAGASGVAAGMLAAQVEAPFAHPFFDLTIKGRAEHGPLAEQLLEDVGLDVECRATGILRVATTESERVDLQRMLRWQTARGLRGEWIESRHLGECEPLLSGAAGRALAGGAWFPDEGQVRSPRLVQALAAASIKRGARMLEGTWALGFETSGERVTAVRTPTGPLHAERFVLAAGVWSADFGLGLPVAPVKGQIATLRALNETLRQVVWGGDCYLVPRVDGEVILGATQEDGNYDARPTLAGIGALSEAALELLPWSGKLVLQNVWAGLRPAAPDRYPILGAMPGFSNLWIATAHFRNGVLLGPLTGRLLAEHITRGTAAAELAPFNPARFA